MRQAKARWDKLFTNFDDDKDGNLTMVDWLVRTYVQFLLVWEALHDPRYGSPQPFQ